MYTHTKFDHEFSNCPAPQTAYFVCCTPRTGSSLLCEGLCQTGLAGAPTEYFDETTRRTFCETWRVSAAQYMTALTSKKTTPNGVFGIKAHFHQFKNAFDIATVPDFCNRVFFIWVSRIDSVRQAVSYWRAIQTNQWASTHARNEQSPKFDFHEIDKLRLQIEWEERCWRDYFYDHSIEPLRFFYEDFSNRVDESVRQCLEFLGVQQKGEPGRLQLTLNRQSDQLSDAWARRFRREQRE